MLSSDKNAVKRAAPASAPTSAEKKQADLEFASANQQLEGFPGKISEAVVAHEPDLEAIARDAKRFGAQLPAEENLSQPPLFQTAAASDGLSRPA